MSERIGVCGDCGARFKIPEAYTRASAKCRKCGGIIEIPQIESEVEEEAPAWDAPPFLDSPPATPSAYRIPRRPLVWGTVVGIVLVVGATFLELRQAGRRKAAPSIVEGRKPVAASVAPAMSPTKPEPAAPEAPSPTRFVFDALARAPGTTQEEWERMQEIGCGLDGNEEARKLALEKLRVFGIKAVPVVVNSINGLDLSIEAQWQEGWEVARFIQDDLTAQTILIPYRADWSSDPKEAASNGKVLKSIVDYWNTLVRDTERWGALLQKCEEKRAGG